MYKIRATLSTLLVFLAVMAIGAPAFAADKGYANPDSVISVQQLKDSNDFVVIDYSGKAKQLIPGAIFIDRNRLFIKVKGVKLMQPPRETFERVLGDYGISIETPLALYSDADNKFAARLYWDLKTLGHDKVRLIDGGLPAWKSAGYPTVTRAAEPRPRTTYKARTFDRSDNADLAAVKQATGNKAFCIVDTRSAKEWQAGHIPGAVNVNFADNLQADKTFKPAAELRQLYAGVDPHKVAITHCLGGIRAAHSWFVLKELLGYPEVRMYDASWWEYEKSGCPIHK